MPNSRLERIPSSLALAIASGFNNGLRPYNSSISGAIGHARIKSGDGVKLGSVGGLLSPGQSELEVKVLTAFANSVGEQSLVFADALLQVLRYSGTFQNEQTKDWVRETRRAFLREGLELDANGFASWEGRLVEPARNSPSRRRTTADVAVTSGASSTKKSGSASKQRADAPTNSPSVTETSGASSERDVSKEKMAQKRPDGASATTGIARKSPNLKRKVEIFLVHGHNEAARLEVESFIVRTTGIIPIVLMLQPSAGQTVIEKFEQYANTASYAVVLMNDDDQGNSKTEAASGNLNARPRQNVVFEFGYFVGTLKRRHVAALVSPGVEKPSDVAGLVYISYAPGSSDWKEELRREMRAAKIPIVG